MSEQNPKMEGSYMIDVIPQVGECPLRCSECFYNGGKFYRTLNIPLIPTLVEASGKIVRVNSGHDSNLQYDLVMKTTAQYPEKFYNTSLPRLRFGWPTVLTVNGRDIDKTFYKTRQVRGDLGELMAVRFRVNTWNIPLCMEAIDEWHWTGVPFLLTDMRYSDRNAVKEPEYYQYGKHLRNEYWKLNRRGYGRIFKLLSRYNVYWCGNPTDLSTRCADCQLCIHFYWKAKARLTS